MAHAGTEHLVSGSKHPPFPPFPKSSLPQSSQPFPFTTSEKNTLRIWEKHWASEKCTLQNQRNTFYRIREMRFTESEKCTLQNQRNSLYRIREIHFTESEQYKNDKLQTWSRLTSWRVRKGFCNVDTVGKWTDLKKGTRRLATNHGYQAYKCAKDWHIFGGRIHIFINQATFAKLM